MWLSLCLGGVLACAAEEEEGDGVIDTSEECEDAGGYVIVSPAGRIDCRLDEELIGTIPQGIEGAISEKKVTYDFERLMQGATLLKCSEFGEAMIARM